MASALAARGQRLGRRGGRHGAVGVDHLDRPALGRQPVGQRRAPGAPRRLGQQHPPRPARASAGRGRRRAAPRPRSARAPGRRTTPAAASAAAVPGPMAATRAPAEGAGRRGSAGRGSGSTRVGRGEARPSRSPAPGRRRPEGGAAVVGVGDLDGRHLDRLGAQRPQPRRPGADAWSRARVTTTRRPNSGPGLEPRQVEPGHLRR